MEEFLLVILNRHCYSKHFTYCSDWMLASIQNNVRPDIIIFKEIHSQLSLEIIFKKNSHKTLLSHAGLLVLPFVYLPSVLLCLGGGRPQLKLKIAFTNIVYIIETANPQIPSKMQKLLEEGCYRCPSYKAVYHRYLLIIIQIIIQCRKLNWIPFYLTLV